MSNDRNVGAKPQRALLIGAALGLLVAVLLVVFFATQQRDEQKTLKPRQAPLATQN